MQLITYHHKLLDMNWLLENMHENVENANVSSVYIKGREKREKIYQDNSRIPDNEKKEQRKMNRKNSLSFNSIDFITKKKESKSKINFHFMKNRIE